MKQSTKLDKEYTKAVLTDRFEELKDTYALLVSKDVYCKPNSSSSIRVQRSKVKRDMCLVALMLDILCNAPLSDEGEYGLQLLCEPRRLK